MALSGSDSDGCGHGDEEVAHQRALRGETPSWPGARCCMMAAVAALCDAGDAVAHVPVTCLGCPRCGV
jgi:hypothetical protein